MGCTNASVSALLLLLHSAWEWKEGDKHAVHGARKRHSVEPEKSGCHEPMRNWGRPAVSDKDFLKHTRMEPLLPPLLDLKPASPQLPKPRPVAAFHNQAWMPPSSSLLRQTGGSAAMSRPRCCAVGLSPRRYRGWRRWCRPDGSRHGPRRRQTDTGVHLVCAKALAPVCLHKGSP
jgi:hypothetical protein